VVRKATVAIYKDEFRFSAGHIMLLSDNLRETLHGHDYAVEAIFDTIILDNGMAFDCRVYKDKLKLICEKLDYHFILPAHSKHMRLAENTTHFLAYHDNEVLPFLKKDAIVLPITNVTLEELSFWFLQQLITDVPRLIAVGIEGITLKVFNGRNESAASSWGSLL
jgi:6-pyruvoyltetrahydropterin/6-carboxytetrahydropterin synthase